uniref:DnaJ homologue subfamily C member 28 conserved domain-containing protein n=1 Tax=Panagrolaimus sp. ES5 TaxID=591445 RepID=A0AC34FFN1_9BILA
MALKFKSDDLEDVVEETAEKIVHDIQYTAPQHRQYLEYGGIGFGTPSARQKQFQQYRVYKAVENAAEFVMDKALKQDGSEKALQLQRERNYFSKKHKLTGMIDRVVEEMILSSMNSGEFSNLKGSGKPLKYDYTNPYIDETEKRINDIMKNNGFAPPWIMQEGEIRADIAFLRKRLREEYCRLILTQKSSFQNIRSQTNPTNRWEKFKIQTVDDVRKLNQLIQDYNLTSPIYGRHFLGVIYEKELKAAIEFVEGEESEQLKAELMERLKKEDAYRGAHSYQPSFWGFLKDSFRPSVA